MSIANAAGTKQIMYGAHNKPTGSYTGDGTTGSRTVSTGGVGGVILIRSLKGHAIVTPTCAVLFKSGGVSLSSYNAAHYNNGSLGLATADECLNASGVTYYYHHL